MTAMPVASMLCYLATSLSQGAAGMDPTAGPATVPVWASDAGTASGTGSTALALREPSAAGIAGSGTEGWAIAAFPSGLRAIPEEGSGARRPDASGRGGGEEVAER